MKSFKILAVRALSNLKCHIAAPHFFISDTALLAFKILHRGLFKHTKYADPTPCDIVGREHFWPGLNSTMDDVRPSLSLSYTSIQPNAHRTLLQGSNLVENTLTQPQRHINVILTLFYKYCLKISEQTSIYRPFMVDYATSI